MTALIIFDRQLVRTRRDRAATNFADYAFLYDEVAERLIERLELMQRGFPRALVLGSRTGGMMERLQGRFGIETLVQSECSEQMARRAGGLSVVADEEFLPFADASLDLVISPLTLHTTNDLPGALAQIRRVLKPDGLLLAGLFALGTLAPLRDAFLAAEAALGQGSSPHVAPFTDVRDGGALLQRAGFALPVADAESVTVTYQNQSPGFAGRVPYVLAYVLLEEGIQILTNIVDADPAEIRIGQAVRVCFEDLAEEISIPVFRLL